MLGFFGIYKYKSFFYNLVMYNKTMKSKEIVYVGSIYTKQISLLGDSSIKAKKIFNSFKRFVEKSNRGSVEEI